LKLTAGVFEVKSTGGDTALGGDDLDRALADLVVRRTNVTVEDPKEKRALLDASRAAKHRLTDAESTSLQGVQILRTDFEEAIAPLLARTGAPCRRALKDAALDPGKPELDGVILVGGATRVPAVRAYVAKLFGKQPLADIDPDQVVALGA